MTTEDRLLMDLVQQSLDYCDEIKKTETVITTQALKRIMALAEASDSVASEPSYPRYNAPVNTAYVEFIAPFHPFNSMIDT